MFAQSNGPRFAARRRGIVLVLILGMLGLMALIGVTFATFAGQSLRSGRNASQGAARPQAEALMDFALAQLINDTNNPLSAIRGHSLLRDMYGNDSTFRGSNPTANTAAEFGGLLTQVQSVGGTLPLRFTGFADTTTGGHTPGYHSLSNPTPFADKLQYVTNIPITGQYYGLDFTRWIVRFAGGANGNATLNDGTPSQFTTQTFEVLEDIADTTSGFHLFTLSAALGKPTIDPAFSDTDIPTSSDHRSFIYNDPNLGGSHATPSGSDSFYKNYSTFTREINGTFNPVTPQSRASTGFPSPAFVLDGRYMRAFNGPGATSPVLSSNGHVYPYNQAAYGNFRIAATMPPAALNYGGPDSIGMDEDYDACDLENWFLALQSADGQVMIPSFHRPGILTALDWTLPAVDTTTGAFINKPNRAKILRPRVVDNSPLFPPDPSTPDANHRMVYDIDNDGDGLTDSVWLDLGYPVQRDPTGRLFKPLFAFMVIGLNGRLPLNTAGNLQARAIGTTDATINALQAAGAVYSTTIPTLGSNLNAADSDLTSTGMVPYPGYYPNPTAQHQTGFSSQVFLDSPLYDHTSHLGYSVNEISPKFALQNAPNNLYPRSGDTTPYFDVGTTYDPMTYAITQNYAQYDDASVPVALTQLRNILAGTMPPDAPNPYPSSTVNTLPPAGYKNSDGNVVAVGNKAYLLPNSMADGSDLVQGGFVARYGITPVPGRWGEPAGVAQVLGLPTGAYNDPNYPMLAYGNASRAGVSVYGGGTVDAMDDDFDGMDPYLPTGLQSSAYSVDLAAAKAGSNVLYLPSYNNLSNTFNRNFPEDVDAFDAVGQRANATERARLFTTPQDTAGIGRQVALIPATGQARPYSEFDFGIGNDSRGRVGHFRYFRPAGMPQQVLYPYTDANRNFAVPYYVNNAAGQQFLMPLLMPAGQASSNPAINTDGTFFNRLPTPDLWNNRTHGFQAALTPQVVVNGVPNSVPPHLLPEHIASLGAMPFDFDPYAYAHDGNNNGIPAGYNDFVVDINQNTKSNTTPKTNGTKLMLFSPTINPYSVTALKTNINTLNGPNLGLVADTSGTPRYPIPYGASYSTFTLTGSGDSPNPGTTIKAKLTDDSSKGANDNNTPGATPKDLTLDRPAGGAAVVNGYMGGGLNKDEADEMNLYAPSQFDSPYVNADLEWLYRKHDIDGATLYSRLGQLAPVSFLNPADGLTRRRLFSVDSWDLISFAYANDNPTPYAGVIGGLGHHSVDHDFSYNSRFNTQASPSFEIMNQVASATANNSTFPYLASSPANAIATEFLPNPTIGSGGAGTFNGAYYGTVATGGAYASGSFAANSSTSYAWPHAVNMTNAGSGIFGATDINAVADAYTNLISPSSTPSMTQVQTPSLAHRDRRINLNFPLPVSHDPAEPVRQKWCRETYQLLKTILPPASVDTPEELAQLSQFVVNIIDFRDPDNAMTRFVNTDLVVTDVLTKTASNGQLNNGLAGAFDTTWTVSPPGVRFADPVHNATEAIPTGSFPFDPSLYSPNPISTSQDSCRFLVQHGMEYCPIAINEAMAYTAEYAPNSTAMTPTSYQGMFIELVNTLTESQDNPKATYKIYENGTQNTAGSTGIPNSSAVSVAGWDIIVVPDSVGWGRPDPISGDVNPIVVPIYNPQPSSATTLSTPPPGVAPTGTPPPDTNWVNATVGNADTTNWGGVKGATARFTIPPAGLAMNGLSNGPKTDPYVKAISGQNYDKFIIGDYRVGNASYAQTSSNLENNPVVLSDPTTIDPAKNQIDIRLPIGMNTSTSLYKIPDFNIPTAPGTNEGVYYWVYLRRPANPFDVPPAVSLDASGNLVAGQPVFPNQVTPNREMVVVDCIRMPVISATGAVLDGQGNVTTKSSNTIFSAARFQPYRGGHLVYPNTDPTQPSGSPITQLPTTGAAANVKTICPPSPPYAYGYSEQMQTPDNNSNATGIIQGSGTPASQGQAAVPGKALTQGIRESINDSNPSGDSSWCHFPFFDRDFNNVAELLLVPCCPPGLFTKQFVEEPYPGNVTFTSGGTTYTAVGTDNSHGPFGPGGIAGSGSTASKSGGTGGNGGGGGGGGGSTTISAPSNSPDPTQVGRQDFNFTILPTSPTFPYLSDNFYYTAASVGLPGTSGNINAGYTQLTTEIGGWTGAGWHKMLEFFEVPSSAHGATGFAANGDNYDWYRADVKPGLLNLNLIIDDEVFAGLVDDPRMNEALAAYQVVNVMSGALVAQSYIPYVVSQIDATTNLPVVDSSGTMTGAYPMFATHSANNEAVVDSAGTNRLQASPEAGRGYSLRENNLLYNNTHATNTQSLVTGLKAAFSDFLKLRHGGSGYLFAHGAGDVGMGDFLSSIPTPLTTTAIAADRPFRSLSYPDINYTILRPASLPPSPANPSGTVTVGSYYSPGTNPVLPLGLGKLFTYGADSQGGVPYVQVVAGTDPTVAPDFTKAATFSGVAPLNLPTAMSYQYVQDPGIKNPFLPIQYVNTNSPGLTQPADYMKPLSGRRLAPPYEARVSVSTGSTAPILPVAAPFPPTIPPTPLRRLFQIPDRGLLPNPAAPGAIETLRFSAPNNRPSNASLFPSYDSAATTKQTYMVNQPVITPQLSTGNASVAAATVLTSLSGSYSPPLYSNVPNLDNYSNLPPTLFLGSRPGFAPDNRTTQRPDTFNNFLGDGAIYNPLPPSSDQRQHPLYRTELLQKISNLTTVRTHQFAVWITIGFFDVVKVGTPELGIPDILGAEFGSAGDRQRFRSFFVIDRTKATGFNPYYPGNFRDCVTYRRRIE